METTSQFIQDSPSPMSTAGAGLSAVTTGTPFQNLSASNTGPRHLGSASHPVSSPSLDPPIFVHSYFPQALSWLESVVSAFS